MIFSAVYQGAILCCTSKPRGKREFTWFCTINLFSGFQELQQRYLDYFQECVCTYVPWAPVFHAGSQQGGWLTLRRVFQRALCREAAGDQPSPRSGAVADNVLSPFWGSSCAVAARCHLCICCGRALPAVVAALPSLPEDWGSPAQPHRARAVAGSEAPSTVSNCVVSAGAAACSFVVWSSESAPHPHFY